MATVLETHQISTAILELIVSAQRSLFIVTPYFKPWPLLEKELERAGERGVKVVLVLRNGEKNHPENYLDQINKKHNVDVIYVDNLHAKVYLTEDAAVISSMNLYSASESQNVEIGYLLQGARKVDEIMHFVEEYVIGNQPAFFRKGRYYEEKSSAGKNSGLFNRVLDKVLGGQSPEFKPKELPFVQPDQGRKKPASVGFCIRCGTSLPKFDPKRPYCMEHYRSWARYKNPTYQESYCTRCGAKAVTTMEKPLCNTCFADVGR